MNYSSPLLQPLYPSTVSLHHSFSRKDRLPLRSDCLWKIESGSVRTLTWDDEGFVATLGFWGVGEIIGQALSRVQPYQVECLSAVKVCEVPISGGLQDLTLSYAQRTEELLSILQGRYVPARLLQLLEWLAHRFGRTVRQGKLIDLRLTHQEIAETIGTSRVTITRLLGQFEQEGRLCRLGPHFVLPIEVASS
ncbi:MAG TPA: Crp/Fnr family transcriptional regulator [Thermosynechococcaceae cyanobacterium]